MAQDCFLCQLHLVSGLRTTVFTVVDENIACLFQKTHQHASAPRSLATLWRMRASSPKVVPTVLSFCDSSSLHHRFPLATRVGQCKHLLEHSQYRRIPQTKRGNHIRQVSTLITRIASVPDIRGELLRPRYLDVVDSANRLDIAPNHHYPSPSPCITTSCH